MRTSVYQQTHQKSSKGNAGNTYILYILIMKQSLTATMVDSRTNCGKKLRHAQKRCTGQCKKKSHGDNT